MRNQNSVRGPTSALSSFLRERGIRASGLSPYGQLPVQQQTADHSTNQSEVTVEAAEEESIGVTVEAAGDESIGVTVEAAEEEAMEATEEEALIQPQVVAKKKRKKPEYDDTNNLSIGRSNHSKRQKVPHGVSFCSNCNRRFHKSSDRVKLCDACSSSLRRTAPVHVRIYKPYLDCTAKG